MRVCRLIAAEEAHHSISRLCRVLGVSRSGFCAWRSRPASARAVADAALTETIRRVRAGSRGTDGAPRVHAERADAHGVRCGRKRVARLMRTAGLTGRHRRRAPRTTRRDRAAAPAPDPVRRALVADAPNTLWTADTTYLPTWSGFLDLAVVRDAFGRRVVGWAAAQADHLRAELVVDALEMALWRRRPAAGLIHHSDRGGQHTSRAFGRRCREAGVVPSMGSVGDAHDNASTQSFFATLECALVARSRWRTHAAARTAAFDFIEAFYNPRRRHSGLGYLSPAQFELRRCPPQTSAP